MSDRFTFTDLSKLIKLSFIFLFFFIQFSLGEEINANLRKAMEYDLTIDPKIFKDSQGKVDRAKYESFADRADRDLAVKYYLAALEEISDSYTRAKIYNKLGRLYSGTVNTRVLEGYKEDNNKAADYFQKSVNETPDLINNLMIDSRGGCTLGGDNLEEKLQLKMDYYEWLRGIDKKAILQSWEHYYKSPNESAADTLMEFLGEHDFTIGYNVVFFAKKLARKNAKLDPNYDLEYDPQPLLKVIERFPWSAAEKLANKEINSLFKNPADDFLKDIANEKSPPEVEKTYIASEEPDNRNESKKDVNKTDIGKLAEAESEDSKTVTENKNYNSKIAIIILVLGGLFVLSAVIIGLNRKTRKN